MNQENILPMAYSLKAFAKLGYTEIAYIQFSTGIVDPEPFKGYDMSIDLNKILYLCQDGNLDIDSDELINRIMVELETSSKDFQKVSA